MPKHAIIKQYTEFDSAKTLVHVLKCKCGWKDKGYNPISLKGTYRHHVVTEHNKGN